IFYYYKNHAHLTETLGELIHIKTDPANQQLLLGFATAEAARRIQGETLKIPVQNKVHSFTVEETHVMDGFHVDILGFDYDRATERYLWTILAAWGAPPIGGSFTQVSKSFGARTTRYRLTFATAEAPKMFRVRNRLIDEIIFLGRCHRVYAKGWYNHKLGIQRANLDIAAKELKIPPMSAKATTTHAQAAHPSGEAKRQCTDNKPATPWRKVTHGPPGTQQQPPLERPWVTNNVFDVLRQHVVVSPMQISNVNGEQKSFVPQILEVPDAPLTLPEDEYIGGTKVEANRPVRIEMPLEAILDEFAALDRAALAHQQYFQHATTETLAETKHDLSVLTRNGNVDRIQQFLDTMPTAFNIQLRRLATETPELLLQLVQLRLLSRWMRSTWGGATPFYKIYSNIFGHRYSHEVFASDFNTLLTSSKLVDYTLSIGDDEATVLAQDCDAILVLTELLLATTAPMFYASDMAVAMLTKMPVFTVPTHTGFRSLASPTLSHVLLDSPLQPHILQDLESLLTSAASADQSRSASSLGTGSDVDMTDSPIHDTLTMWLGDIATLSRLHASSTTGVIVSTQIAFSLEGLELTQSDLTAIPSSPTETQG
ncbi:unnamed protein product, partial [Aphanomyces euteiches]